MSRRAVLLQVAAQQQHKTEKLARPTTGIGRIRVHGNKMNSTNSGIADDKEDTTTNVNQETSDDADKENTTTNVNAIDHAAAEHVATDNVATDASVNAIVTQSRVADDKENTTTNVNQKTSDDADKENTTTNVNAIDHAAAEHVATDNVATDNVANINAEASDDADKENTTTNVNAIDHVIGTALVASANDTSSTTHGLVATNAAISNDAPVITDDTTNDGNNTTSSTDGIVATDHVVANDTTSINQEASDDADKKNTTTNINAIDHVIGTALVASANDTSSSAHGIVATNAAISHDAPVITDATTNDGNNTTSSADGIVATAHMASANDTTSSAKDTADHVAIDDLASANNTTNDTTSNANGIVDPNKCKRVHFSDALHDGSDDDFVQMPTHCINLAGEYGAEEDICNGAIANYMQDGKAQNLVVRQFVVQTLEANANLLDCSLAEFIRYMLGYGERLYRRQVLHARGLHAEIKYKRTSRYAVRAAAPAKAAKLRWFLSELLDYRFEVDADWATKLLSKTTKDAFKDRFLLNDMCKTIQDPPQSPSKRKATADTGGGSASKRGRATLAEFTTPTHGNTSRANRACIEASLLEQCPEFNSTPGDSTTTGDNDSDVITLDHAMRPTAGTPATPDHVLQSKLAVTPQSRVSATRAGHLDNVNMLRLADDDEPLNDTIMHKAMKHIQCVAHNQNEFILLDSYQVCRITSKEKLQRIIRKANPGCVLAEVTKVCVGVFVPGPNPHDIGHWFLLCVVLGAFAPGAGIACKGFVLDSLPAETRPEVDAVHETLQLVMEILQQPDESLWKGIVLPAFPEFDVLPVPTQDDAISCGLHLLQNINHTVLGGLFDDLSTDAIRAKCTSRDIVPPFLMRAQWYGIFRGLQSSVSARFGHNIETKLKVSVAVEQCRPGHLFWRKFSALMMSWFSPMIVPLLPSNGKPWCQQIIDYAKPGTWNTEAADMIPQILTMMHRLEIQVYSLLNDGHAKLVSDIKSAESEKSNKEAEVKPKTKPIMQLLRVNADTHYELIVEVNLHTQHTFSDAYTLYTHYHTIR